MAQIINELATIEVNDKVLQQLEIGEIYQTFQKNYQKLDDLKNFRSEYEKKNRLMRWWHNDKLQDAQLDSAEVQAEFSKTIGQLMMISIIQSKKLSEQQMQLNNQQGKLKAQANGIAEHASELQKQHHVLAEQSQKLEELVREYFELKGLTEDGAEKLIGIAREVKTTKDQMLQEFTSRANDVEAVCAEVQTRIKAHSAQLDEHIRLSDEKTLAGITSVQQDTREALASYESSHRVHLEAAQSALNQSLEKLSQSQHETAIELQTQQALLESRISDFANKHEQKLAAHQEKLESIDTAVEDLSARSTELGNTIDETKIELSENVKQQQIHQSTIAIFHQEISKNLKRLSYSSLGILILVLGIWAA